MHVSNCWPIQRSRMLLASAIVFGSLAGCGTMKTRLATDQLLVSDAVDRSIMQLDFSPLGHAKVFLDTTYLRQVDSVGFVNAAYIISSLRERMVAAHCILEENRQNADYIVEARVGALGTDGHEVNYGLPASGAVNTTAAILAGASALPVLPEISLAKRDERRAAAKIGVYAYHRESKQPVWTPGMVKGESLAKSTWFLGAGPFQQGTIYESTQFAGTTIQASVSPVVAIQQLLPIQEPIDLGAASGPAIQRLPPFRAAEPPQLTVEDFPSSRGHDSVATNSEQ